MTTADEPVVDRGVGILLTIAGWTGGGVLSALVFQATRGGVTTGPFPTARPTDAFIAVVAGSFLVGPLVAAALLWRWRQPRLVGTAAMLVAAGLVTVLPLVALVSVLLEGPAATVGILLFVAVWGLAVPAGARWLTLGAGAGDTVIDRLWLAAGGARPDAVEAVAAASAELPWIPVSAWAPLATYAAPEPVAGPPIDHSRPPVSFQPPEGSGFGLRG